MRECLQCKKSIEEAKVQAKFCSSTCRVKYFRSNGGSKKREDKLDFLIKQIEQMKKDIAVVAAIPFSIPESTAAPFNANKDQKIPQLKLKRSFENYKQLKIECDNFEDWEELKQEILSADNLTDGQKSFLIK